MCLAVTRWYASSTRAWVPGRIAPTATARSASCDGQFHGLKTFPVQIANRPAPPSAPIDFAGPPGTYPAISYSRVLNGAFPPSAVRGKIVIVGAAATSLRDVYETPMSGGAPMSAPELQANATATVLRGSPLRARPGWSLPIMAVVLALAALAGIRFGTSGS